MFILRSFVLVAFWLLLFFGGIPVASAQQKTVDEKPSQQKPPPNKPASDDPGSAQGGAKVSALEHDANTANGEYQKLKANPPRRDINSGKEPSPEEIADYNKRLQEAGRKVTTATMDWTNAKNALNGRTGKPAAEPTGSANPLDGVAPRSIPPHGLRRDGPILETLIEKAKNDKILIGSPTFSPEAQSGIAKKAFDTPLAKVQQAHEEAKRESREKEIQTLTAQFDEIIRLIQVHNEKFRVHNAKLGTINNTNRDNYNAEAASLDAEADRLNREKARLKARLEDLLGQQ